MVQRDPWQIWQATVTEAERKHVKEHIELVALTIEVIFQTPVIEGMTAFALVKDRYGRLKTNEILIASHDEPFDVAYDMIQMPPELRMRTRKQKHKEYDRMVREYRRGEIRPAHEMPRDFRP